MTLPGLAYTALGQPARFGVRVMCYSRSTLQYRNAVQRHRWAGGYIAAEHEDRTYLVQLATTVHCSAKCPGNLPFNAVLVGKYAAPCSIKDFWG